MRPTVLEQRQKSVQNLFSIWQEMSLANHRLYLRDSKIKQQIREF